MESDGERDRRRAHETSPEVILQEATDRPHADLIADIVGHPDKAPTLPELLYMNPPLDKKEVQRHLNDLIESGLLERHSLPETEAETPTYTYRLAPGIQDVLSEHGLFPEGAWSRQYESVQKPDRILEMEQITRSYPGE